MLSHQSIPRMSVLGMMDAALRRMEWDEAMGCCVTALADLGSDLKFKREKPNDERSQAFLLRVRIQLDLACVLPPQCTTLWALALCCVPCQLSGLKESFRPVGWRDRQEGHRAAHHHIQSLLLEVCSYPSNVSIFSSFFHVMCDAGRQISPAEDLRNIIFFLF